MTKRNKKNRGERDQIMFFISTTKFAANMTQKIKRSAILGKRNATFAVTEHFGNRSKIFTG